VSDFFISPVTGSKEPLRITIEGTAASGKTTLAFLLKEFLNSHGHACSIYEDGLLVAAVAFRSQYRHAAALQPWKIEIECGREASLRLSEQDIFDVAHGVVDGTVLGHEDHKAARVAAAIAQRIIAEFGGKRLSA
jgi:uridine kinase